MTGSRHPATIWVTAPRLSRSTACSTRRSVSPAKRSAAQLYERANRLIMELLPAVPLVHVRPVNALAPRVKGNPGSPVPWERLALYSVS